MSVITKANKYNYIIDTVACIGYRPHPTNIYLSCPTITTGAHPTELICNGWDFINARVVPGMDIVFSKENKLQFKALHDWGAAIDLQHNEAFRSAMDKNVPCSVCNGKTVLIPSNLNRVCLNCFINDGRETKAYSAANVDQAVDMMFSELFNDCTPLNGFGAEAYRNEGVFFTTFKNSENFLTQHGLKKTLEHVKNEFIQSNVRALVGIDLFTGIGLIVAFFNALYDPEITRKISGLDTVEIDPVAELAEEPRYDADSDDDVADVIEA